MTAEGDVIADVPKKPKSLLQKYDVPLDHLEFDYIRNCRNLKEIEKIVKILKSNDEGYFPDLLKCAEEKLRTLNSNHRLLRTDAPIMTKDSIPKEEWKSISDDLQSWNGDITTKEMVLNKVPKSAIKTYPDNDVKQKKSDKINSFDYSSWDKFDADKECMKIDLEAEKREAEKKKKEIEMSKKKVEEKSVEELALDSVVGTVEDFTKEERERLALQEKEIGNEFYKTNNFKEAITHYTKSIYINPTCTGFNNRAATYLKQCKFTKALGDLNEALKLGPNDVKALYRRAIALQHKNKFQEALEDALEVLRIEPGHVIARHLADQLRDNCASLPKKHKLKIQDKENPYDNKVKDVTEEEMLRDYKDVNFIEVNDWGLPKIMCNCNGKYTDEPGIRHEEHVRYQHIRSRYSRASPVTEIRKPQESSPQALKQEQEQPAAKKIEIVELEKIVEEDKTEENQKKSPPNPEHQPLVIIDKRTIKNEINLPSKNTNEIKFGGSTAPDSNYSKMNKTAKNINIQDSDESSVMKEINFDFNTKIALECGCGDRSTNNIEILQAFRSDIDSDLKHKANALRSICPQHLASVIGCNLDIITLVNLFKSLYYQFDHKNELSLIAKYYNAISRLERFKIIEAFMSPEDKKLADNIKEISLLHSK